MKIYDISMNINQNMTVYKNDDKKRPIINNSSNYSFANHYETNISMNLHTGTHIDAPLHMIKDGKTIETYPLESFITKCKVYDLTYLKDRITSVDLDKLDIKANDFVIFKTINSLTDAFDQNFIFVDKSAAQLLVQKKVIGVGIDALGIERSQPEHETHKSLLSQGIIILEGLRLKAIPEGEYILNALPLKIDNVEASPTRAILIDNN